MHSCCLASHTPNSWGVACEMCSIVTYTLDYAEGAVPIPAGFQGCAAQTQAQQGQEPTSFPESNFMQF